MSNSKPVQNGSTGSLSDDSDRASAITLVTSPTLNELSQNNVDAQEQRAPVEPPPPPVAPQPNASQSTSVNAPRHKKNISISSLSGLKKSRDRNTFRGAIDKIFSSFGGILAFLRKRKLPAKMFTNIMLASFASQRRTVE